MTRLERVAPILALIRKYESDPAVKPQGVASAYDVVYGGIRREDRPKKLSDLSISRVLWWQDLIDSRYMSEAAGAYQIMEDTLRGLVANGAVDVSDTFSAETQDRLALALLDGRGWARCEAGKLSVDDFAIELAQEWASFPVPRAMQVKNSKGKVIRTLKAGQSYYAGDGLNKAHASVAEVRSAIEAALATPKPASGGEDAVVAWVLATPDAAREVGIWLSEIPKGVTA